jgi:hypothetical protein
MRKIIYLLLLTFFTACISPYEAHIKKSERAKERIASILRDFPELLSKDTLYITKIDTHVTERTIVFRDSIYVPKEVLDTSVQIQFDSIYTLHKGNLDVVFQLKKDRTILLDIINKARTIYYTDTVRIHDTTFNTVTKIEYRTTIDTEPSFWWSLWFNVRNWLWLVVLLVVFIVIYKLVRK